MSTERVVGLTAPDEGRVPSDWADEDDVAVVSLADETEAAAAR